MRERSGFFDSDTGVDRYYMAQDVTQPFLYLVTNGVQEGGEQLHVVPDTENLMTVIVRPGYIWINGAWYRLEAEAGETAQGKALILPPAQVNNYIAYVVATLDLDSENAGYGITIGLSIGTESTNPQPPALVRSDTMYQLALAKVLITPATAIIPDTQVTDTRFDYTLCGIADFAPQPKIEPVMAQGFVQGYVFDNVVLPPGGWEPVDADKYPEHVGEFMQYFPPVTEPASEYIFSDSFGYFNVDYALLKEGYRPPNDCITETGRVVLFYAMKPGVAVTGEMFVQRGGRPVG